MNVLRGLTKRHQVHYVRFLIVYLLLSLLAALSNVLVTQTTGTISETAIAGDLDGLLHILLVMAGFTAVKLTFSALATLLEKHMDGKIGYVFRQRFAKHIAHIAYPHLARKNTGNLLSLYSNDLPNAAELLTGNFLSVLSGGITLIISAVFMVRINVWLTLIFFALYPPLTYLQIRMAKPIEPLTVLRSQKRGVFNDVVNDCLQNTSLVLSYGLEGAMEERYMAAYQDYFEADAYRSKVFVKLIVIGVCASFLPTLWAHVGGAAQAVNALIGIGDFVVFATLATEANTWLQALSQQLGMIKQQQGSGKQLLDNSDEPWQAEEEGVKAASQTALTIEHVSFSYDQEHPVLSDVSLTIPQGTHIALVGASGCGKSTLAKLMLGLYPPESGSMRWFGQEGLSVLDARRHIAYVPQDNHLFAESILQNIIGKDEPAKADAARLAFALEGAGLTPFIKTLAEGVDTPVAEFGENLSGGQKQRIAIARALYYDTPILLMDEATSALDLATEKHILDQLRGIKGKTMITVAHRLAAVQDVDCIYLMDQGHIVESGTFEQLMRDGTRFHAMYERQSKEEEQYAN